MEHLFAVFPSHSVCWQQRADIIALHAVGDGLTAISYYLIPFLLLYATRKYKFDWTLKLVFYVYAVFIFLCGTTHFLDVVMIWYISENLLIFDGWLRVATGVFSLFSAGVTVWALQMFLRLASKLVAISGRAIAERAEYGKMSPETFREYKEVYEEVEAYLHTKQVKV